MIRMVSSNNPRTVWALQSMLAVNLSYFAKLSTSGLG